MSRTKPDYSYQLQVKRAVRKGLSKGGKVVLAAGCGAGKTRMSTSLTGDLLRDFPASRILVLTHGQTIIRSQFAAAFAKTSLGYFVIERAKDYDKNMRCVVALPHTIMRVEDLGTFDFIIIDEAHQFYSAENGMVAQIITRAGFPAELLLTATPSPFVLAKKRGEDIRFVVVSQSQLIEAGVITDPDIYQLATDAFKFTKKDFSRDENLKSTFEIKRQATFSALDEVIEFLKGQKRYRYGLFTELGKTLIAVSSQQQGRDTLAYLKNSGIKAVLSTSNDDPFATEIQRFVHDDSIFVLIVVGRGVLGFDCPQLGATIDMTGTLNPDRLFQLLNRVSRRNGEQEKIFVKVMPTQLAYLAAISLSCAVALGFEEVLLEYAGMFKSLEVPEPREIENESDGSSGGSRQPTKIYRVPAFRLMEHYRTNRGEALWTNFEKAQDLIRDRNRWDYNACQAEALKFASRKEFERSAGGAYIAARRNNWLDELCAHMEVNQTWAKPVCAIEAKKYDRRTKFQKGCPGAYYAAHRNGWLDQICKHMPNPQKGWTDWTKAYVQGLAGTCRNRKELKLKHAAAYRAARKNNWLDSLKFKR